MFSLTLTEAWSAFRYFLKCMSALTEEPARLAAQAWFMTTDREEILTWLRPLERMARLLLLVEAATITLEPLPPRQPTPRREIKGSRLREAPEGSETWRVAFRIVTTPKIKVTTKHRRKQRRSKTLLAV